MQLLKELRLTRTEYSFLLVLLLIEFSRGAYFLTFLPLFASNYLGISIAAAGLAVSAHFFAETLAKGTAGWQLDRRGHSTMLAGLLLGLLALVLMKIYPSVPVLILSSALLGFGVSPVWLAVISRVAPVRHENRAARMGIIFAVWLAGCGGGPAIINFFITHSYFFAFWLLIILWAMAFGVAATIPGGKNDACSDPESSYSFKKEVANILRHPAVKKILLPGMFLQTLTGGLLLPLLPVYAQNHIGLTPNQYALLLLVGGAAAALSFLPMGRLADRINLKWIIGTGFGLTAISLGALSMARQIAEVYLLAALIGFSYAAVLPAWNNLLAKVVPPERQATGWGVFATIEGMGIATGPAVGGILASHMGIQAPILVSTVLLALMACFYIVYPLDRLFSR